MEEVRVQTIFHPPAGTRAFDHFGDRNGVRLAMGVRPLRPRAVDPAVTQMFKTNSVPASFHYYAIGRPQIPYVIIGLDPAHRLSNAQQWDPIPVNEVARKAEVMWIPHDIAALVSPEGAWIVDAEGNRIGIWYSSYPRTSIHIGSNHEVAVYSPHVPGHEELLGVSGQ